MKSRFGECLIKTRYWLVSTWNASFLVIKPVHPSGPSEHNSLNSHRRSSQTYVNISCPDCLLISSGLSLVSSSLWLQACKYSIQICSLLLVARALPWFLCVCPLTTLVQAPAVMCLSVPVLLLLSPFRCCGSVSPRSGDVWLLHAKCRQWLRCSPHWNERLFFEDGVFHPSISFSKPRHQSWTSGKWSCVSPLVFRASFTKRAPDSCFCTENFLLRGREGATWNLSQAHMPHTCTLPAPRSY